MTIIDDRLSDIRAEQAETRTLMRYIRGHRPRRVPECIKRVGRLAWTCVCIAAIVLTLAVSINVGMRLAVKVGRAWVPMEAKQ